MNFYTESTVPPLSIRPLRRSYNKTSYDEQFSVLFYYLPLYIHTYSNTMYVYLPTCNKGGEGEIKTKKKKKIQKHFIPFEYMYLYLNIYLFGENVRVMLKTPTASGTQSLSIKKNQVQKIPFHKKKHFMCESELLYVEAASYIHRYMVHNVTVVLWEMASLD